MLASSGNVRAQPRPRAHAHNIRDGMCTRAYASHLPSSHVCSVARRRRRFDEQRCGSHTRLAPVACSRGRSFGRAARHGCSTGQLRAAPLLGLAAAASRSTCCAPRRLPSGKGLSAAIQTAMTASTDKRIVVVGHSLGGALATIAAVDLVESYGAKVMLHTCGSPRTFKRQSANRVQNLFAANPGTATWPTAAGITTNRWVNYNAPCARSDMSGLTSREAPPQPSTPPLTPTPPSAASLLHGPPNTSHIRHTAAARQDPVPSVPPSSLGWLHVGNGAYIRTPARCWYDTCPMEIGVQHQARVRVPRCLSGATGHNSISTAPAFDRACPTGLHAVPRRRLGPQPFVIGVPCPNHGGARRRACPGESPTRSLRRLAFELN